MAIKISGQTNLRAGRFILKATKIFMQNYLPVRSGEQVGHKPIKINT